MRIERVTRQLTLGGLSALMAACSLGPAPRAPLALYDLGPAVERPVEPSARLPIVFVVHEATGPVWLDGGDMLYRLAYDEPQRLRRYASSQWAVSPLTLVGDRLRAELSARCARSGAMPDLGVPADYHARVAVEEFGQVFDSPRASHAVVRLRLVLVKGRGHAFVGQKQFAAEVATPSPDARGGVDGLTRALEECASQAVAWIAETVSSPGNAAEVAR
jgi:cholesterol transport system auxiliary component